MSASDDLTLPQRTVLSSVAALDADGETPAHANVISQACRELVEELDDIGTLTEAEVGRALNALEAEGFVSVPSMDDTSPTGKGRPAYELSVDAETVSEVLAADERLADATALDE
jgi:Cdc6-like AAA superfamily ATPase